MPSLHLFDCQPAHIHPQALARVAAPWLLRRRSPWPCGGAALRCAAAGGQSASVARTSRSETKVTTTPLAWSLALSAVFGLSRIEHVRLRTDVYGQHDTKSQDPSPCTRTRIATKSKCITQQRPGRPPMTRQRNSEHVSCGCHERLVCSVLHIGRRNQAHARAGPTVVFTCMADQTRMPELCQIASDLIWRSESSLQPDSHHAPPI